MEVKIYSTQTCPYCRMAKEYLDANNISYQNFDVGEDTLAREEMARLTGQMGVPAIVIGGEIVIGFDKERINALLGI